MATRGTVPEKKCEIGLPGNRKPNGSQYLVSLCAFALKILRIENAEAWRRGGQVVPIAKEGWCLVVPAALAGAGAAALGWTFVGGFLLLCALALGFFFRDPKREARHSPAEVVCPADGKVISITEVDETDYLNARSQRISIFMSLFNVHVNYVPIAGRVDYLKHRKGTFRRANLPEASLSNENNSVGISGEGHRLMVRQIAGAVARRIVCRVGVNDAVQAGQRMGMIKFGSRVDVFIPVHWKVLVKEGDRVKGGISQIARMG